MSNGSMWGSPVFGLFTLSVFVLLVVASWKVFEKAGQPGWSSLIPIYNIYVLCKIAGKPGWWVLLFCIPLVNVVIAVIVDLELAKAFGKSAAFGIGLLLIPYIFYPILAFGEASYRLVAVATPA